MRDKKSIGGFFSGLLYDEDPQVSENESPQSVPQTTNPPVAPATTRTVTATHTTTQTVTATPQTQASVSVVNEEMHQSLIKLIEDNNLEGFDYLEFMDSVQKMGAVNLPEAEKYKVVFTTAQSFGVTVEKLLEAVDHYLKVLDGHKSGFDNHVNSQISQEVKSRKDEIANLEKDTEALNLKIAEISQQIAGNTTKISALTQEVAQEELKINMVAKDFNTTYEHVVNRMQSDKEKIRSYLSA